MLQVQGYSVHTTRRYRKYIEEFILHLAGEARSYLEVDHGSLLRWLQAIRLRGVAEGVLQQSKSSVSSWYKWLIRIGKASRNPIEMLTAIKVPKTLPKPIDEHLAEQILGSAKGAEGRHALRDLAILETMYATGCRQSELASMDLQDLHLGAQAPYVLIRKGKGKRERVGLLTPSAVQAIEAYLPSRAREIRRQERPALQALFVSQKGNRMCATAIHRLVIKAALSGAGIYMTPHQWRHSFATHMLNNGADPRTIQEMMGHESLTSTQRYLLVTTKRMQQQFLAHHPRAK